MKMVHLGLNYSRLLPMQPRRKKTLRSQTRRVAMSSVRSIAEVAGELCATFSGLLLRPAETGYEEARRVHNGLVDKRPALIAQCRGVADAVDAVNLTRKLGLEVAVRGGGHNVAGRATIDGGLVIDLTSMKKTHVDPENRTVRAQGGVTWGELNRATQLHALAVTGGVVSSTGIAGLTLGGGLGWLMGKYALGLDNLVSDEVVLADGRVVTGHRQVDAGEDKEAPSLIGATASCGSLDARDLGPDREGLRADGSVLGGGEVIAVEMEEVVDLIMGREEPLRLAG